MEFKICEKNVLLTTHKTYCEVDEQNGLQAVFHYSPFQKFSSECEKRGPVPKAFIIRNIFRLAHRVVGVLMDVEYIDSTGMKVTHTVHLTDQPPAVLLPIINVGEKTYALLVNHRRVATGMKTVTEAITGVVGPNDEFSCKEHENALEKAGFQLSLSEVMTKRTFTIGGDEEGTVGYTFYTMRVARTLEEISPFLLSPVGSKPINDAGSSRSNSVLDPRLCAIPLSEVYGCGDAKASLAMCLLSLPRGILTDEAHASTPSVGFNIPVAQKTEKENMFHNVRQSGAIARGITEDDVAVKAPFPSRNVAASDAPSLAENMESASTAAGALDVASTAPSSLPEVEGKAINLIVSEREAELCAVDRSEGSIPTSENEESKAMYRILKPSAQVVLDSGAQFTESINVSPESMEDNPTIEQQKEISQVWQQQEEVARRGGHYQEDNDDLHDIGEQNSYPGQGLEEETEDAGDEMEYVDHHRQLLDNGELEDGFFPDMEYYEERAGESEPPYESEDEEYEEY